MYVCIYVRMYVYVHTLFLYACNGFSSVAHSLWSFWSVQWQRYLDCDPLPEPEDEAAVSTFLTLWEMDNDWMSVDSLFEGIQVAEKVGLWVWSRRWVYGCGREGGFMGVVEKVGSWVWLRRWVRGCG